MRCAAFVVFLLTAWLLSSPGIVGVVHAQQEIPLILLLSGDLWVWTPDEEAFQQLTFWGYNHEPVISPDGNWVAYNSEAEITVDAIQRSGGIGGGATPSNIWLMELATGEAFRVIDQPPDASLFIPGVPDKGVARSTPTWSPDGTMLAWTELTYPEGENRLGVYDLARGETRVMDLDIPEQYGVPTPLEVEWGGGIAVRTVTYDVATEAVNEAIRVYDPSGALLSDTDLQATDDAFSIEFLWIADDGKDYVGVLYNTGRWMLIDPLTGATQLMNGAPALSSRTQSRDGVSATFMVGADGYDWSVIYPDGRIEALGTFYIWQIFISPGGGEILLLDYPDSGVVSLWRDGQLTTLQGDPFNLVNGASWAPMAWCVLRDQNALRPSQETATCPGFLPSRLTIGGQGRVLPGSPNNLRSQPTTASVRLSQIPSGGVFTVLEGPQCADNAAWWRVEYAGTVGWTAEGQGGTYWVEPLP